MDQQDLFYWAYTNYQKEFEGNRDDYLFKKGVNSKKYPKDEISKVEVVCEIDEDWILAIEKGLDYIAKAIKEDRQFIRNEGEVLPIEKIRRVGKDSIIDLSKHSNYITKVPEDGETVIPEKLMMTKRENDYSIYENRVVYTTLCYLKDFVATRLEKIKDAVNKYEGNFQLSRVIELGYRHVDVAFSLKDIRKNDPITLEHSSSGDKIKRLDMILNGVLVLLKTPLMQEVSKAPLVKRPIVKTNVLKMNTNFKETLNVFDYVCSYNKDGYEIKEVTKTIAPLNIDQQNSFTDLILLGAFMAYKENNNLNAELARNYQLEAKRRQAIKDDETLKRIQELMDKAQKSGKEIGEYLLALEEGYKILEGRLDDAKEELQKTIEDFTNQIAEINEKHEQEIMQINADHQNELIELRADLEAQFEEEKASIAEGYKQEIENMRTSFAGTLEQKEQVISDQANNIATQKEEIDKLTKEKEDVVQESLAKEKDYQEKLDLAHAENTALRGKEIDPKDYTSKERFDELERELQTLDNFMKKTWKLTKKEIKKHHMQEMKEEVRNHGKAQKNKD